MVMVVGERRERGKGSGSLFVRWDSGREGEDVMIRTLFFQKRGGTLQ